MKKLVLYVLVLLCSGLQVLVAQTVTGTVRSARDGQTIPGVTILVKGTTTGAITDADGNYSINVPSLEETLVFSFVGFSSIEVPLNGQTTVNVEMEPAIYDLEEVMVVAYGTTKKASFTGSAAVVESEEIKKLQTSNVAQNLEGVTTGIQVLGTGQPGETPTIRIRGISSINGNSSPLIVVDGAPYGGYLNGIDPNDVESISVLKDASATALYGARASGGVIMITTKKGEAGKTKVNFSTTYGVSSLAMPLHYRVNNAEYYEMHWEAIKMGYLDRNPGAGLSEAETYAHDNLLPSVGGYNSFKEYPLNPDGSFNTSVEPRWGSGIWEDELFKPGPRQDYHLSLSGQTDEGLNHYFSVGYFRDKGVLMTSKFERYSARLNLSQKVNDWFEAGLNTSFNHGIMDAPWGAGGTRFVTDMPDIYPPWIYDITVEDWARDEEGNKLLYHNGQFQSEWPGGWYRRTWEWLNPLATMRDSQDIDEQDNLSTRGFVNFYLLPGLSIENSLSVDYSVHSFYQHWSGLSSYTTNQGGSSYRRRDRGITYTLTNLIRYSKSLGNHNISLLAGHEAYSYTWHGVDASRSGFPTFSLIEVSAASNLTGNGSWEDNHRIESYLSNAEYNYNDKYYISASFRRDGSSRFAPGSRWGNFWSAGASWRISEESFMENYTWLDNLTLRASYGTQGNERISGYYAWLGLYDTTKDLGKSGFQLNTLTNEKLHWEKNIQANFGIEANILGRWNFSIEYFNRKSKDLLFNRELPLSSGLGSVAENIGDVANRGIELSVNSVNILSGDFRWETQLNMTSFKNVITSLPSEEISAGWHRYVVGRSVYDFYLRDYAGVNPENGNAMYFKNIYETDPMGDPVLDENGDPIVIGKETTEVLSEASFYYVGSSLPDLYGNVVNSFYYKGFDLSFNIMYKFGGKIYDQVYQSMCRSGTRPETFAKAMVNYWTPENTDTDIPRLTDYGAIGNQFSATSTRFLVDGTYLRLRNLTLGYTIPHNIVSRFDLSKVRVFFQGDNFITIFKYGKNDRSLDPEAGLDGGSRSGNIPTPKIFSGGIQVTF